MSPEIAARLLSLPLRRVNSASTLGNPANLESTKGARIEHLHPSFGSFSHNHTPSWPIKRHQPRDLSPLRCQHSNLSSSLNTHIQTQALYQTWPHHQCHFCVQLWLVAEPAAHGLHVSVSRSHHLRMQSQSHPGPRPGRRCPRYISPLPWAAL